MSKHVIWMVLGMVTLALAGVANADTYTFTPNPADLYDLNRSTLYKWGLGTDWLDDNEVVTSATLYINGIYNYDTSANILYAHLLDDIALGVTRSTDRYPNADSFASAGPLLFTWSDTDGPRTKTNLAYEFTAADLANLNAYLESGTFGFGFDADCHYYNNGVKLVITTGVVPEPATITLMGLGLAGAAAMRLRRRFVKTA